MGQANAHVLASRYAFGIGPEGVRPLVSDPVPGMVAALALPQPAPAEMTPTRVLEFLERSRQNRARVLAREAGQPEPPITVVGSRERLEEDLRVRALEAVTMPQEGAYREVLVRALSNMLSVSAVRGEVAGIAATYEAEAIRPNAGADWGTLLLASASHPAMLAYLDAGTSVGPNSRMGGRRGLNENYAREVMELHTLGVDGGYSQSDIRELALGLTGWALNHNTGRFSFQEDRHEPGTRTLMGRTFAEGGVEQGRAMLRFLAAHPVTARRTCERLAVHYLGMDPPKSVVDAMDAVWRSTGGMLPQVMRAMLQRPEAWDPAPLKPRTPEEWLTAACRLIGMEPSTPGLRDAMPRLLRKMRQYPFSSQSPQGYPVDTARWISPDGVMERLSISLEVADMALAWRPSGWDPRQMAARAGLGQRSATAVAGAPSLRDGMAMVLLSPEFMWR